MHSQAVTVVLSNNCCLREVLHNDVINFCTLKSHMIVSQNEC